MSLLVLLVMHFIIILSVISNTSAPIYPGLVCTVQYNTKEAFSLHFISLHTTTAPSVVGVDVVVVVIVVTAAAAAADDIAAAATVSNPYVK